MKTLRPIVVALLLFLQLHSFSQVQWYQPQDGNGDPLNATAATMARPYTSNSFLACYLWSTDNEFNTWKISKTTMNGVEQKTFYRTGISSIVEFKPGRNNAIYVFEKSFTTDYAPLFTIYKLDANLHVTMQRSLTFPDQLTIYNMNAFEIDDAGNLYFAGDGQRLGQDNYIELASYVVKLNKDLGMLWQKTIVAETSFSKLHIDCWGRVLIVENHYSFFPEVRIRRYSHNGQAMNSFTTSTDINRNNLYSTLDDDDNIILYGSKSVDENSQAVFIKRISRSNGHTDYNKTYFPAQSTELNDLKMDKRGNIFLLVRQFFQPDIFKTSISKINSGNGNIVWNHLTNSTEDSSNFTRLVMEEGDRFFAIGEKKTGSFFSRGYVLRMKKNGQSEGNFTGPDSVDIQRSHILVDGIINGNNQLIAIGNTWDLDTMSFTSNHSHSFAARFGQNNNCYNRGVVEEAVAMVEKEENEENLSPKLHVYPNPVHDQLRVSKVNPDEFDRAEIYNMQGALVGRQVITGTEVRMDIQQLADGIYVLLLRSTLTLKEKSIKFVVRK